MTLGKVSLHHLSERGLPLLLMLSPHHRCVPLSSGGPNAVRARLPARTKAFDRSPEGTRGHQLNYDQQVKAYHYMSLYYIIFTFFMFFCVCVVGRM